MWFIQTLQFVYFTEYINISVVYMILKKNIYPNVQMFNVQFVVLKPLYYCFEETIGFDVKASFTSRPLSRLIR